MPLIKSYCSCGVYFINSYVAIDRLRFIKSKSVVSALIKLHTQLTLSCCTRVKRLRSALCRQARLPHQSLSSTKCFAFCLPLLVCATKSLGNCPRPINIHLPHQLYNTKYIRCQEGWGKSEFCS